MEWLQPFFFIIGLLAIARGLYELTQLAGARIARPFSVEHAARIAVRLRLSFDQIAPKPTLRTVAFAPLRVGSTAAVSTVNTQMSPR